MKHCKILRCRTSVYRCGLCLSHYNAWLETGAMPGETRAERGEDDVYIKRSTLSQLRHEKDKEIAQLKARIAEIERQIGETRAPLALSVSLGSCPRCGRALHNVAPGISAVAGGPLVCTSCLNPGETEVARARGI